MKSFELKKRYFGKTAEMYDGARIQHSKWIKEDRAILRVLQQYRGGELKVLDMPCGTGRALDILVSAGIEFDSYEGLDVSDAMLSVAETKIPPDLAMKVKVSESDALSYARGEDEEKPDLVLCLRFVNWLSRDDLEKLIQVVKSTGAKSICITNRSVRKGGDFFSSMIFYLLAKISYSTWKRQQNLHDVANVLEFLGSDWMIEKEVLLETRVDGTSFSLLVFERK